MTRILMLALALAFLLGGLWIGWLRWARPYQRDMIASCQSMLALTIVTVAGGLIGSLFWWMDAKASFPWTLSPLASRMLASAGVGFATAGIFALERRQDRLIRLYLVLLTTYLAPLIVVIILFHLDRFNWRAPVTYAFFLIAIGMTAAALWNPARKKIARTAADAAGRSERAHARRPVGSGAHRFCRRFVGTGALYLA